MSEASPSRLTDFGPTTPPDNRSGTWHVYVCECGTVKKLLASNVRRGRTRSCGCFKRDVPNHFKHGHSPKTGGSKTYRCWKHLRQRCGNENNSDYPNYGGRGISVDPRWDKFDNFLTDMGESPSGMSIDRINNDGNYEAANCRWATHSEQMRNRRRETR